MKVAFDFETKAIDEFPNYPPKPVSLALSTEHGEDVYFAWGHPTNNNCTEEEAKAALRAYWDNPSAELIAHNLSFDLCVAAVHWGFSLEPAATIHDTMVMAFLLDPYAYTYALKPSAEKHLGLPPEERDAIQDWLIANGVPGATNKDWGGLICEAPGDIVGVYAMGDTRRTLRLFNEIYWPQIQASGMQDAYRREIDLIPVMLENTIEGIAVDIPRLTQDVQLYEKALADIGQFLFQQLNCEPFNVDSDAQLADAIDRVYPGLEWVLTPKGKRSTSKANLEITLSSVGGLLGATLQYRASIATCLNTFMKPWLKQAVNGDGRIRCQWNTTRSDTAGARTGRLSSKPNFQNIPTLESAKFKQAIKAHSTYLEALGYPPLPNVRCYVVADDENSVLLDRDFSGQELRVMAHFEDGQALQAYKENPFLDLHQWAADFINSNLGLGITRKQTKTCIAKGSLVLTDTGLTPIEDVTGLQAVWDGVEYVKHAGVLSKGIQSVYTYSGLTATLDHEVYTNDYGKIDFGTAIAKRASLTASGRAGQTLWPMAGNISNSLAQSWAEGRADSYLPASTMYKLQYTGLGAIRQLDSWLFHKMPQLLYNKVKALPYSWSKILGNQAKMRNSALSRVQVIRRTWYTLPIQLVRRICRVYRDYTTSSLLQRPPHRSHRQQWALPTWQLAVSYQYGECAEQANKCLGWLQRSTSVIDALMASAKDGLSRYAARSRAYSQALSKWGIVGAYRVASAAQGRAEVYDIANAGPRHRFTVSDKLVSNCSFAILYGSGLTTLAAQMGGTTDEAARVKGAYLDALPGLQDLINGLKSRARQNLPFRTWGGRLYYCEPAKFVDGRWRSYDYKMVNYLIQGSSADITKEALIRYHRNKKHGRIILCVHDEICVSCPIEHYKTEMEILRACMEGVELDAKLVSDGEIGRNWHELVPADAYGVVHESA